MELRVLLSFGALASLVVTACSAAPPDEGDPRSARHATPSPTPSSSPVRDAGSPADDATAVLVSEASAPANIPPIDAAPPSHPPSVCSGGGPPDAYILAQDGTLFAFDPVTFDMRALGVVPCFTGASASLAVSSSGLAYLLAGDLYEVDLRTLACTKTAYAPTPSTDTSVAVGAGSGGDRLWWYVSYASAQTPELRVSDVASFVPFETGAVTPGPALTGYVDLTMDAYGRLFALGGSDGTLRQLDPATASVVGEDHTGFDGTNGGILVSGTQALMAYGNDLYFFSGPSGGLSRYDVATKDLRPLGLLDQAVVAAAAVPCVAADTSLPDAGVDGGGDGGSDDGGGDGGVDAGAGGDSRASVNPFSAGDAWIGTYVCPQGLTDLAVVVDSVNGNLIQARFDFDWTEGDTNGSFVLDGTFDPTTREATFAPGAWVSQPGSTWSTVGLDGYVDLSGTQLAGTVTHAGCGAFSVER